MEESRKEDSRQERTFNLDILEPRIVTSGLLPDNSNRRRETPGIVPMQQILRNLGRMLGNEEVFRILKKIKKDITIRARICTGNGFQVIL